MKSLWRVMPWLILAVFIGDIAAILWPKKPGEFHIHSFGSLPVLLEGRVQPIDSVARNSLLQIRSTGDLPLEQVPSWQFWRHAKKLRSTPWLLEVLTRPELADTRPIFLIHHAELLGELKLNDKGIERSGLRYYSFDELKPVFREISDQGRKASALKTEEQTTFHKQAIKLANALMLYQKLKVSLQPEGLDHFSAELAEFQKNLGPAQKAAQATQEAGTVENEAVRKIARPLQQFQLMAEYAYPLIVPPGPGEPREKWRNAGESLLESFRTGEVPRPMLMFAAMADAYRHANAAGFNKAVADYRAWLEPILPKEVRKATAEYNYNQYKLFLHATIIYISAFVLAITALLTLAVTPGLAESLRRSSYYLIVLAGLVHTAGLIYRMVLEGRPPVTNLYSSAVFIGWGAMVGGLILEWIYRVGIGAVVASFVGFVTLIIAHNLALGGDTMIMLRAVLDTNFWLATHVVVITLGYSATFAAGLIGILYIFLGVFTPQLRYRIKQAVAPGSAKLAAKSPQTVPGEGVELGAALSKMVYGIVCFATLFSFLGTVLGGIWADQSWGRFWGWDPKENGALLIVLWNAIILHARWGKLVGDRGLMNLAIFGNAVTAFSWFGVNMLNIGLHSYGFMEAASKWLFLFYGSQLAIIALGSLPLHLWRSFRDAAPDPGTKPPGPPGRPAPEPA